MSSPHNINKLYSDSKLKDKSLLLCIRINCFLHRKIHFNILTLMLLITFTETSKSQPLSYLMHRLEQGDTLGNIMEGSKRIRSFYGR